MDVESKSGVKDRLFKYLKYKQLTKLDFCKSLSVSPGYVNSLKQGMSQKILEQIHELYPDLNMMWLLFGEGDMTSDVSSVDDAISPVRLLSVIKSQQDTIRELSTSLKAALNASHS